MVSIHDWIWGMANGAFTCWPYLHLCCDILHHIEKWTFAIKRQVSMVSWQHGCRREFSFKYFISNKGNFYADDHQVSKQIQLLYVHQTANILVTESQKLSNQELLVGYAIWKNQSLPLTFSIMSASVQWLADANTGCPLLLTFIVHTVALQY